MSKFKTQEITTTKVNEYGEIIEETTSKSWTINKNSEPFFLTYLNSIAWIYQIKSVNAIKVLHKLIEKSSFNTGEVTLCTQDRVEICRELNMLDSVLSRTLKQLIDIGIISGGKGRYKIDPNIYWKGDYKTREKLINSNCIITITPNEEFNSIPPNIH